MSKTIQDIIDNQKTFKKEILKYLRNQVVTAKSDLKEIKTDDEFIQSEKDKLVERFSKTKFREGFDKLFFMNSKRSKENFAWWDDEKKEVLILKYEKR